jgi:CubicO group peptidase (beta-lactamase class C family)
MNPIDLGLAAGGRLQGDCDPAFEGVLTAFKANFEARGEVGAAVCVYDHGRKVVDLWGGVADPATGAPWTRDTVVCMMSVGKACAGLCVLKLVDQGRIALDRPVADYWPGFAQAGKAQISVEQLLGGLGGTLYADSAPEGALMDWAAMVTAIERQAPEWESGTRGAYQSMSAGFLFGELVRQVDGRDIARFFREEIAVPLGLDYGFGVSADQSGRVSPIIPNPASDTLRAFDNPATNLARAWGAMPKTEGFFFNSEVYRQGVFPSANGHGNARAIARLFAALSIGGTIDGVRVIGPDLVARLPDPMWIGVCGMTGRDYSYSLAMFVNRTEPRIMGPNPRAFGHPGMGGALGWADPDSQRAFSFSPNRMCEGASVGERCMALVEAAST